MIWVIARKTILRNIYNWKFMVSFILIVVLMILNALFFSQEIAERSREYARLAAEGRAKSNLDEAYLFKAPSPLIFLSEGGEQYLPKLARITLDFLDDSFVPVAVKSLVPKFESLDWAYIIGILMSLLAIFFSYDAVAGEKEAGTLSLALAGPLRRRELIVGVYLGSLASLALAFATGAVLNLLILGLSRSEILQGDALLRILTAAIISLLYISLFVSIGIFSSCLFAKSSTALISALLLWVFLIVVVPYAGSNVARTWKPLPSEKEISAKVSRIRAQHRPVFISTDMMAPIAKSPASREVKEQKIKELEDKLEESAMANQRALQKNINAVLEDFARKADAQLSFARSISRISPLATYRYAVEELAWSGYAHHRSFIKSARSYMEEYTRYADKTRREKRDEAMPTSYGVLEDDDGFVLSIVSSRSYKYIPLDSSSLTPFVDKRPAVSQSIVDALWDILALFSLNLAFLTGSLLRFQYYDVR